MYTYNNFKTKHIMNNYVGYYRVSTEEQGNSGLGLHAQKASVLDFASKNGSLLSEYRDVESGLSESRKGIEKAIQDCKMYGATLLVKELSRITRGGFKYRQMLEQEKINYIEVNSPHDPQLVKEIKFSLAKEERDKISARTKDALGQIKSKLKRGERHVSKAGNVIKSLGTPSNLTDESRKRAIEVRKRNAMTNTNNMKAGKYIVALRKLGKTFDEITKELNDAGFKSSRGGSFNKGQTFRLYKTYN